MRIFIYLSNRNKNIEFMWPMSKKIKKLIDTSKPFIQNNTTIEDYGWPSNRNYLLKQRNKSKKENASHP